MSQSIFIESKGLAINEKEDMDALSEYAKKGWILEKTQFTGYQLKKEKPQNLIYSIGIEDSPNEEYFRLFKESGWTHVCSNGHMHFFKAPLGTTPIYTDQEGLIEKYKIQMKKSLQSSKYITYVILMSLLISVFTYIGWLPAFAEGISVLVGYFSVIALIFTLLPYFSSRKNYKSVIK